MSLDNFDIAVYALEALAEPQAWPGRVRVIEKEYDARFIVVLDEHTGREWEVAITVTEIA